jgi:hypothetical protein
MFAFDRSAFAVVIPLALLVAVVLWSSRSQPSATSKDAQAVAANLPSK